MKDIFRSIGIAICVVMFVHFVFEIAWFFSFMTVVIATTAVLWIIEMYAKYLL